MKWFIEVYRRVRGGVRRYQYSLVVAAQGCVWLVLLVKEDGIKAIKELR